MKHNYLFLVIAFLITTSFPQLSKAQSSYHYQEILIEDPGYIGSVWTDDFYFDSEGPTFIAFLDRTQLPTFHNGHIYELYGSFDDDHLFEIGAFFEYSSSGAGQMEYEGNSLINILRDGTLRPLDDRYDSDDEYTDLDYLLLNCCYITCDDILDGCTHFHIFFIDRGIADN